MATAGAGGEGRKRVRRGLLLAPLTRLVSLAMPPLRFPSVYRYAVTSTQLFAAVYLATRARGLQSGMLGLNVRGYCRNAT